MTTNIALISTVSNNAPSYVLDPQTYRGRMCKVSYSRTTPVYSNPKSGYDVSTRGVTLYDPQSVEQLNPDNCFLVLDVLSIKDYNFYKQKHEGQYLNHHMFTPVPTGEVPFYYDGVSTNWKSQENTYASSWPVNVNILTPSGVVGWIVAFPFDLTLVEPSHPSQLQSL